MLTLAALLVGVLAACVFAAGAWASVYEPTPQAAALAATEKLAKHEVKALLQPDVSYSLGTCRVLHREPWVAYVCGFELHGVPMYCHLAVTVAVKYVADHKYRGQEVGLRALDTSGC